MKTIGMLGGMSWESTTSYYKALNEGVKNSLGGLHSAKICMVSVDFAEIEKLQHQGNWAETANILIKAAKSVEAGGADFLLICTNTMHKVASQVSDAVKIPLLHIADATGAQLVSDNLNTIGLLGTKFTMQQGFYKDRLTDKFSINVLVPTDDEQEIIHSVIYQELCLGIVDDSSREQYVEIIQNLTQRGAQGIILGCTEIGLLVEKSHAKSTLYDTTVIHALAAVEKALK